MKNLKFLILLVGIGCESPPATAEKPEPEIYVGQILNSEYISGGSSSYHKATIVETDTGKYPVEYFRVCVKGKKVWLTKDSLGYEYLKVEGQNDLWEISN
jgi:hypothetical protein